MEAKDIKSSVEYDPQEIEGLVSNFERIANDTKVRGALVSKDILPLTNFLFLLRNLGCSSIAFSHEQVKRIREAYSLLSSYYPVPENPDASFGVLRQIMAARGCAEQLLSRSEARG